MNDNIDVNIVAEDMYNVWTKHLDKYSNYHCKYDELTECEKNNWVIMAKSVINSIYSQSFDIVRR